MDIDSDIHLHCSVDKLAKEIVKCFRKVNKKLNKSVLVNFVNKIIYRKYFSNNENAYHNYSTRLKCFK